MYSLGLNNHNLLLLLLNERYSVVKGGLGWVQVEMDDCVSS